MNLLLDTQSLLWFVLEDTRLSKMARESIVAASMVFVSPASYWEIAIKISLGKYELPKPFEEYWEEQMNINGFTILPIAVSHAAKLVHLPFHHRDPFDRLIIAQAQVEEIPVVSSDLQFDLYAIERIW